MELKDVRSVAQVFPDGSRSKMVELIFERDGVEVVKRAKLANLTARNVSLREFVYQCSKLAREADRDIAIKQHGQDFRKYCEYQSNFWDLLPMTLPIMERFMAVAGDIYGKTTRP